MTFGPLEFAARLRAKAGRARESAIVKTGAPAADPPPQDNSLTVVAGPGEPRRIAADLSQPVRVVEAVVTRAPTVDAGKVILRVRLGAQPLVLVLSSHHAVDWQIEAEPGSRIEVVMLAGAGESTVRGAGAALVTSIGGFYAFRRGSHEYQHLEDEVMRCTLREIGSFHSISAESLFEID